MVNLPVACACTAAPQPHASPTLTCCGAPLAGYLAYPKLPMAPLPTAPSLDSTFVKVTYSMNKVIAIMLGCVMTLQLSTCAFPPGVSDPYIVYSVTSGSPGRSALTVQRRFRDVVALGEALQVSRGGGLRWGVRVRVDVRYGPRVHHHYAKTKFRLATAGLGYRLIKVRASGRHGVPWGGGGSGCGGVRCDGRRGGGVGDEWGMRACEARVRPYLWSPGWAQGRRRDHGQ